MFSTSEKHSQFDSKQHSAVIEMDKHSASELHQQLESYQCPFNWKPFNELGENIISKLQAKLAAVDDFEEFAQWTRFVLNAALCYENAKSGFLDTAFENQRECDKIILFSCSDAFMSSIEKGLQHISLANKAFLFLMQQSEKDVRTVMKTISSTDDLTLKERASILCVNAAVLIEYGLKGLKESIPLTENALKIDSECGEWHFLLGKGLSRMRRVEDSDNMDLLRREIQSFENAVRLANTKFYMVLLAQSYLDCMLYYRRNRSSSSDQLSSVFAERASQMYREAWDGHNNNPFILGRCARGFMNLVPPHRNLSLARMAIRRGLNVTQNNDFLIQTAGELYLLDGDTEKAMHFYTRAAENGSMSAALKILEQKMKDSSYDPVPDVKRYLRILREKPYQEKLLAILGLVHYYCHNDFESALDTWSLIIESDIHALILKKYRKCRLFRTITVDNINISEIVIEECIKRLDNDKCNEDRKQCETILNMYKEYYPDLVNKIVSSQHQLKL